MKNQLLIIPRLVSLFIVLFLIFARDAIGQTSVLLDGGSSASGLKFNTSQESLSVGDGVASGLNSLAIGGQNVEASGIHSFAHGLNAKAIGNNSFAFGNGNASAQYAFSAGASTASGYVSFAHGYQTDASGDFSFAIGDSNTASGDYSFVGGQSSLAQGNYAFAHGNGAQALGQYAVTFGTGTASSQYSVSFGNGTSSGQHSFAVWNSSATGNYSFALGSGNASGANSFAVGGSDATGSYSASFGYYSIASGSYSFALGSSEASGSYAFAAGDNSKASGNYSFSLGSSEASGYYSFTGGINSFAKRECSFAFGTGLVSDAPWTTVFGRYNIDAVNYPYGWDDADPLFVLGNGTSDTDRSNALTVLKNGNVGIDMSDPTGDLQLDGLAQRMIFSTTTPQQTASARIEFWENHDGISDGSNAHFAMQYDGLIDGFRFKGKESGTNLDADIMTLKRNGRVGIGTTGPGYDLDVYGSSQGVRLGDGTNFLLFRNNTGSANELRSYGLDLEIETRNDQDIFFNSNNGASKLMMIKGDGSGVGVGTTSLESGALLTVAGSVHAQEIKVLASAGVPDYVFEEDYHLRTLGETKAYIEQHKHLPEVPSAAEIEEDGGFHVGEMNLLLLKKIEELTLHLIEKDQQIQDLQKRMSDVESKQN